MSRKINYEIFWLRSIACLSVVAGHAIFSGLNLYASDYRDMPKYILHIIHMSLMFATPTFIFMSEFLFSKSYKNGLPKGFFITRIKYLLIPYLCMGVIYGIVFSDKHNPSSIAVEIVKNIFFGNFVAYFILIIFQFYILHLLLYKKLRTWNFKKVILISLVVNVIYLGIFNFTPTPNNYFLSYFWSRGHWLLAPGWIYYFVIGYYSGKYYDQLLNKLQQHKFLVFLAPIVTLSIVLVLRYYELPGSNSSKRIDVLFYTTSIIFLIMYLSSKIKATPKFVIFISNYSFSIYLLHKLIVDTSGKLSNNIYIHVLLVFIFGIIFSITISYIFNKIPLGKFVVGKINSVPVDKNKKK